MEKKTVVITGILGQGGSYAADKYLSEGWRVFGLHRRSSILNTENVQHNLPNPNFTLLEADICDVSSIGTVIEKCKPDLFLNFAAQSHVGTSYNQPIVTAEINYLAVAKILEAIRLLKPDTKFWQASTSERFGNETDHQNPDTPPSPISPYAVSKVASEYIIKAYQYTYGLYACYGIMYNYESPRRSKAFVTRKITSWIGESFNKVEREIDNMISGEGFMSTQDAFENCIKSGVIQPLKLGNINSNRSWTHCKDVVDGIFMQMNRKDPTNVTFGLEETHTVREFLDEAFAVIGVTDWSKVVEIDPSLFRPSDVKSLKPDSVTARNLLEWEPEYNFRELVKEMVEHDIQLNRKQIHEKI